ncbi:MAG: V-type ATP synthase subunit A, partial [Deltaproteobacteria bacterium]
MPDEGIIVRVSGPTVAARNMGEARMHHRVKVGEAGLLGEVIRLETDLATIQVYEDTTGLRLGERVTDVGEPILVELGPGLLTSVFDGVQRPLGAIRERRGDFIMHGISVPSLDRARRWEFRPAVKAGDRVEPGEVIGAVPEAGRIEHRVMVPPGCGGRLAKVFEGERTVVDPVAVLEDGTAILLMQRWPVRTPRPFRRRLPPTLPFITGQRVFDLLFPLATGATAIVPGG